MTLRITIKNEEKDKTARIDTWGKAHQGKDSLEDMKDLAPGEEITEHLHSHNYIVVSEYDK